MERKLATIQKISEIRPIPGADRIQVALMEGLGWECVIKKDEFNVGDLVVYCEVDSVLPEEPQFEFLRERKFRIRIIKLQKQVSMGLILPITVLDGKIKPNNIKINTDVTEILGVTKYLSPSEREEENIQKRKKHWTNQFKATKWLWRYKWFRNLIVPPKMGDFPSHLSKTDEERIQNMPSVITKHADSVFYASEKIDFQSVTFTGRMNYRFNGVWGKLFKPKYEFIVCSRNHKTNDKSTLYWKIAEKYKIEQILKENPDLSIQGEQGDTKVQGNKYGIKEPKLWVFNIINHKTNYHYDYDEMCEFCKKYGLTPVDLVFKGKLSEIGSTVNDFVEFSKGKSLYANIPREGLVFRHIVDGKKIVSFKIINPDFLLKFNKD